MKNLINEIKLCDQAIDLLARTLREKVLILNFDLNTRNIFNYFKKKKRLKKNLLELDELLNDLSRLNGENGGFIRILEKTEEIKKLEAYICAEFVEDRLNLEKYKEQIKEYVKNDLPNIDLNKDERI